MDEHAIVIILRVVHVVAGVLWVGAIVLMAGFLLPAARAMGAEGGRFMQQVAEQRRLPVYLNTVAGLTLLSGLSMYGRTAAATRGAWVTTPPGLAFGLGGATALAAAILGTVITTPARKRIARLGAQLRASGAAPSATQADEMRRLQARLMTTNRALAALLVVAATAMAVARYV